MRIVNANDLEEIGWTSPAGRFEGYGKQLSEALGRERDSTDVMKRHPFDVELARFVAGKPGCPYHAHSAQWEFYHVVSGRGTVRHADGLTAVGPGDTFLFKPNEPHQIAADASGDMIAILVADNPLTESCYYPDSDKWSVDAPNGRVMRGPEIDYFDGEE